MLKVKGYTLLEILFVFALLSSLLVMGYSLVSTRVNSTSDATLLMNSVQQMTNDYMRIIRECGLYNGKTFKTYGYSPNPTTKVSDSDQFTTNYDIGIITWLIEGTTKALASGHTPPGYNACFQSVNVKAHPEMSEQWWNGSPDPGNESNQSFILNNRFKMEIIRPTGTERSVCWQVRNLPYETTLELMSRYSMSQKGLTLLKTTGDSSDKFIKYSHTASIVPGVLLNKTIICDYDI